MEETEKNVFVCGKQEKATRKTPLGTTNSKNPTGKINLEISTHSTQYICVGVTGKCYSEHPLEKAHSEKPTQENPL